MSGTALAKVATQIVTALSVDKVVSDIIKNNTTVVTTVDQLRVAAGRLVIGSMISGIATKHANERFDALVEWNESRKNNTTDDTSPDE